jgi:putative hydrolase of the HAD superfamily
MDQAAAINCIRKHSKPLDPIPTEVAARLVPLDDVKCVLFDVYGTLFVSGSGDVGTVMAMGGNAALDEALAGAGIEVTDEGAARRGGGLFAEAIQSSHAVSRARGIDYPEVEIRAIWREVLVALKADGLIAEVPDQAAILCLAIEYECRVNPVWPMPGVLEALDALRKKNLLLGIVSNAQVFTPSLFGALLDAMPEALGFQRELCAWSYESMRAKPGTAIFQKVLAHLNQEHGLSPENVVYVGNDMRNDIWTASRCGCRTVLFAGDKRSLRMRKDDPDCKGVTPDGVITDLRQLGKMM